MFNCKKKKKKKKSTSQQDFYYSSTLDMKERERERERERKKEAISYPIYNCLIILWDLFLFYREILDKYMFISTQPKIVLKCSVD